LEGEGIRDEDNIKIGLIEWGAKLQAWFISFPSNFQEKQFPPKRRYIFTKLHGVTPQETAIFIHYIDLKCWRYKYRVFQLKCLVSCFEVDGRSLLIQNQPEATNDKEVRSCETYVRSSHAPGPLRLVRLVAQMFIERKLGSPRIVFISGP
jgi:hypothetical protein